MVSEAEYLSAKQLVIDYEKQMGLSNIPRSVPDRLYILIENMKSERYGGVFSQIPKQVEYANGQYH